MINFKIWINRLQQSMFYWGMDRDGDLVFRLAWVFYFTKYKEHTMISVFKNPIVSQAGRWQGCSRPNALFLDDERDPPKGNWHWAVVRSSDEAIAWITMNGLPVYMSLDHDLGGDDTSMRFLNWLTDYHLQKGGAFPRYTVHSQNPVGAANIKGLLRSYLTHIDLTWQQYER